MASQDQISQFTQESMRIPAAQQDRSRTPRRPHHDWHQPVPTFRGPMHYAMTTPRPSWPPTGLPAPPPLSSTFPSRPTWTPTPPTPLFPPTPPGFSQGLHDHTTFTPQRNNNITPRSPMFVSSPLGTSPIQHGYTCRPIDIPPVDHWKPDVDFHDSNKVNGLDFPSKIRQSRFSSYKDIEGIWILYKSHYGNSCTKGFTILGFVESPMEERPTSSPLTTSTLLYSSQNWCLNSEPGTWTWTNWRHPNHAQRANTSTRKRLHRTWPKRSLSYCNLGFRPILQPTMPVNNVFLNWKLNLPKSNRTMPRPRQPQLRLQDRPLHQLLELYKDNHRLLHHLIRHAYWSLLVQSINGLWITNPLRWPRRSTRSGWKTWNYPNTNKIHWRSNWKKFLHGGTTSRTTPSRPSREQV